MGKIKSKLGEKGINNFGSKMIITEYNTYDNISVYFPEYNCTVYNKRYNNFKNGAITCPYEKRTFGIGYLGEGKYKTREDGKLTYNYQSWCNILSRCYDIKNKLYESYGGRGVKVHDEWLNFQNYAKWRDDEINKYNKLGYTGRLEIDKDILIKHNTIYACNKCCLVPKEINSLFENLTYRKNKKELPIGVKKNGKKYQSFCRDRIRGYIYLGTYDTPKEAFLSYKIYKECLIKRTADEFKWCLPENVYNAMYNYEVEIDD